MNMPVMIDEFVLRIENWARWAKSGRTVPVSCRSLEHKYRSPQCWTVPDVIMPIDILDALNIERGLVAYSMPVRNRRIIVYSYIAPGYNFDAFCSKNKIHGNKLLNKSEQFQVELKKSETMLKNILARHEF